MRVPSFDHFSSMVKSAGLLIAGAVIGSAVFMSIFHHNLNSAIIENRELQAENEKLAQDNNNYKKNRNQLSTINKIEVVVESADLDALDKVTEKELERRVRSDLRVVIGLKVSTFAESPHIYQQLLSQKTYHAILDKDYLVNIKTMLLIQNELKVWVIAKDFKRPVM
ncbi:hypothetical protein [Paenibacillus rigui]|nr:hypothetical protein [Paenibacillus rigui]